MVASVGTLAPGEYGYFWSVSRGDLIAETFSGTGLPSVSKLDLAFGITKNVLNSGAQVNWDVSINSVSVGTWSWSDTDGTGLFSTSYTFPSIAGGGNYTLAMKVSNEVPGGLGSIAIGDGRMTLTGGDSVPDAGSSLGLLGLGFGALGFLRASSRKTTA